MSARPLVSVILPVYNGGDFLDEAVESILAQTLADLEVVAIDDGSTDGSLERLRAHAARDPRIRVLTQPNAGVTAALNRACAEARGDLLARMDADDVALPGRLARQVEWLGARPAAAVVGAFIERIDRRGRSLGIDPFPTEPRVVAERLLEGNCVAHPTVVMRRAAFEQAGGYRVAFRDAEDHDLWLRVADRREIGNLGEVLLRYRVHPGQVTARSVEQPVLSSLGAAASARRRRSGAPDPADGVALVTEETVLSWGVTPEQIATAVVRAAAFRASRWVAEGRCAEAVAIADLVERRLPLAEPRIAAWLLSARGRALARLGRRLAALDSIVRAAIRSPRWLVEMVGRRLSPIRGGSASGPGDGGPPAPSTG